MTHVSVVREIPAAPQQAWGILRSFRLDYFKGFPHTVTGSGEGAERSFSLPDGAMTERIHALNDREMSLQYHIVAGPWPVRDYSATIRVSPAGEGCRIAWSAEFEPDGADEAAAVEIVEGTFKMNLRALEKHLGSP